MGRPRDAASQPTTADRILESAIELFSRKGFQGVSIREIARSVGINEASIYNHFAGKAALLDAALAKLGGGEAKPGPEELGKDGGEGKSVEAEILSGAARVFADAGPEAMAIWRILMIEQYRDERARDYVRERFLALPRRHFLETLAGMKKRSRIRPDADIEAASAALASAFFEFSFLSNLAAAWGESDGGLAARLREEIRLVVRDLG
jgi:AcrR family transcriptional regulator